MERAAHGPGGRVSMRDTLGFGIGAMAYGVKDNGFSVFLLLFYNQVVGLDPALVGAAILAALVIDAFIDPVVGVLSDRTDTRWGRRLPWIYASALPMMAGWWLLWHPPSGASDAASLAWVFGTAVLVRAALSMNEVPSQALGPELTRDYHARTLLTRWRFVLAWVTGLAMLMLAFGLFVPPGQGVDAARAGYSDFATLGMVVMGAGVVGSALILHRRVGHRSSDSIAPAPVGATLRAMLASYRNPAFLWLALASTAAFVNQGVAFALTNYLLDHVWAFSLSAKLSYVGALMTGVIGAFVAVALAGRRWDKRHIAAFCMVASVLVGTAPYWLRLAGAFPDTGGTAALLLYLGAIVAATMAGVMAMMLIPSMLGDIVEAAQEVTGRREEGLFGAGYWFTVKTATGIGILLSGLVLAHAGFPPRAAPGSVSADVIDRLMAGLVVVSLALGAIAAYAFVRFPIGRADHDARLARLSN